MSKIRTALIGSVCLLGLAAGTIAIAQPEKGAKGGQPEMQLPPGWTPQDMEACMVAGMPGEQHKWLAKNTGVWQGKSQMWMGPGMEPVAGQCTTTITSLYDGRYFKTEFSGNTPGMGPFQGSGILGFDNVSQKFVATWIDSHGSGIMNGTGEASKDWKTLTVTYSYNCPINKKVATMREVQTSESENSMTFELFMNDPKSGKEFKMMHVDYTRSK